MEYSFHYQTAMLMAFIPALINVGILGYAIFSLPKSKTTQLFYLFVLALICWQCNDVMMRVSANEETARFWDKFFSLGVFAMAPLCLHFAAEYTGNRFWRSTFGLLVTYIPFFVIATVYIAIQRPQLFVHDNFWGYINIPRPNSLETIQLIVIPLYIVIAVIVLFRFAYQVWQSTEIKWQALLVAVGILIPTIQGLLTQVIYYLLDIDRQIPVTSTFMTFLSLAVIVAFSRFKLFTISDSVGLDIILKSLTDIVIITDAEKHTKYLNPFAIDILNLNDNYRGNWHIRALFQDSEDRYRSFEQDVLELSLQGNPVKNFETEFLLPNKIKIDVIVSAETVYNNNIPQGVLLIARDITERKKMVNRLRAENMVFELLSTGLSETKVLSKYAEEVEKEHKNSCICAIFFADNNTGEMKAVAAPYLEMHYPEVLNLLNSNEEMHFTQEDLLHKRTVNLESDKLPAFSKEFQKFLIKENIDYIYTEPVTASSGKLLGSLGIFIKAGTDPASKAESVKRILHILGVVLERGNAFSNIETQQKVYTDLVNTIDGIVYEYDLANKKYDFVSNRAPELLGYPLDLWYNELDFQMNHAHPEDKELLDDIMNSFFPETSMECEYRMIAANGDTIWCRDYIRIIYKKDQPVKLKGIIFDNTRAKNSEVEKELAASDLIKRNRDLEQFTYIVSHNLRAPLANIMGCTNAMDFIHDEEERKELIQSIADSAQRLDAVVRDLNSILSIQMVASETIEKIELAELVQDVISSLKPEWRGDFEVQVNLAETPYLNSVKPYVYSIFHNLISNAYKYRSQKKSPLLIITTTARDKMVEMSFKDNGQGIDLVANKQNIFGMYKRFHTDVEGKGMGLFMVKAQVEALQGSIQVASEVNKGTEFIIALPQ